MSEKRGAVNALFGLGGIALVVVGAFVVHPGVGLIALGAASTLLAYCWP